MRKRKRAVRQENKPEEKGRKVRKKEFRGGMKKEVTRKYRKTKGRRR